MSSSHTSMTEMSPSFQPVPPFAGNNQQRPQNPQRASMFQEVADSQPGVGRFLQALSRNLCIIGQRRFD